MTSPICAAPDSQGMNSTGSEQTGLIASWRSVVQTTWLTSGRKRFLGSSTEAPDQLGKLACPVGCDRENDDPTHKGSTS